MGGSKNWLKSLIAHKKPNTNEQDPIKTKNKWKLWRSGSEGWGSSYSTNGENRGHVAASETSDSSSFVVSNDAFTAAMATVMRARPKDFLTIKQEWAAIRIQTAFRAFLARQALRALRAVVRIQAIFRGRQVRKQAAVTLRCMQALVRVQERIRSQSTNTAAEEQNMQISQADPIKHAEESWCNSPGTVDEVRAKLQMRQEGIIKRERAIAYSRSQNQTRTCPSPVRRVDRTKSTGKNHKLAKSNNVSTEWVERWMAAKPWESRLVAEECSTDPSEMSAPPYSRKSDNNSYYSKTSELDSVNVRRNNVTTKISARPPGPNSYSPYDDISTSNSSTTLSPIPKSTNKLVSECLEMCDQKPTYMNLTRSTKAKLRTYQHSSNLQSHRNSSSSNPSSAKLCKDLYPPVPLGRRDLNRDWPSKDHYRDDYLV